MKRIYIAGKYSADNIIDVLNNIRIGIRSSTEVFMRGYAVFCPWLDHQFAFHLREGEMINKSTYQAQSLAWLEVCDAMLALPGWESSGGTMREIARAKELNIPVFYSATELYISVNPEDNRASARKGGYGKTGRSAY